MMSNERLYYFFADLDSYLSEGLPTKEALLRTVEDYRYVFEMPEKPKEKADQN
jgi:hypothetical protein